MSSMHTMGLQLHTKVLRLHYGSKTRAFRDRKFHKDNGHKGSKRLLKGQYRVQTVYNMRRSKMKALGLQLRV